MPNYPSLVVGQSSSEDWLDDLIIDRAINGTAHARARYTSPKRLFNIVHPLLSRSERAVVDAFYLAHRGSSFAMTWPLDGVTYTVMFDGPPKKTPRGADWADVLVRMVEV